MRGSTRNDTTERACCEVVPRVQLNLLLGPHCAKFVRHCFVCEASIAFYRSMVGLIVG